MSSQAEKSVFIRNLIFGIEDSLVSTVGLLAGIASKGMSPHLIVVTGIIYVFVEGFSMAVGSYLSEESAEDYQQGMPAGNGFALLGAAVMFVSFIISGILPLLPYALFTGIHALFVSIVLSLVFLALLGYAHARVAKVKALPRMLRMLILGGLAIFVGIGVGALVGSV